MEDKTLQEGSLNKGLKKLHVQMVALGGVIGSAYFYGVGGFIEMTGPAAFLAFALGGVMVFCTLYCLGELLVAMPTTGSFISYSREFISDGAAAGVGWTYWIAIIVYIPSECIVVGTILNMYVPQISIFIGAVMTAVVISVLNLSQVGNFGKVESILAITKVMAIVVFIVLALLIAFGVIGTHGSVGMSNLTGLGGLFPLGAMAIFANLAIIVMNFAGVEIIALTAGETKNPAKIMPSAIRAGVIRILILFIIPTFLVTVILPWTMCNYDSSAFSMALEYNGFPILSHAFNLIIIVAALSCANCNLYGAIRDMFSMSREGMAPSIMGRVTGKGVPIGAALFSLIVAWIILFIYSFDKSGSFYAFLLSCSGVATIFCWVAICISQSVFRKRLKDNGLSAKNLKFHTPLHPLPSIAGIVILAIAFFLTGYFPDTRIAVIVGIPWFLIPYIIFTIMSRSGKYKVKKEIDFDKVIEEIKSPGYLDD